MTPGFSTHEVDIYPSTICKSSWPHLVLGQSYCRVPNQLSYTSVHSSPIDQDKLCMVPLKCCWWNPYNMKCWQHGPTDVVLAYADIRCWKTSPMFGSVNVWVASNEQKNATYSIVYSFCFRALSKKKRHDIFTYIFVRLFIYYNKYKLFLFAESVP